jgi:UDP-N-acetylglucosamine 2-epimerase (non-hydrolysing)
MGDTRLKVLSVFGTRPEAIKMAPVVRELERRSDEINPLVCITGQHREMLDQVLQLFQIVPSYDLNVMEDNQSPTQVASAILGQLEPILRDERPDWVLVQGDTMTCTAASLAAFYAKLKVGHVEAGLRTYDKWQPFPEEVNRRITGIIADLHFAPTERARANLLREDVPDKSIFVTGNTVIDALRWITDEQPPTNAINVGNLDLQRMIGDTNDVRMILVTAHRRENFGRPLENICLALQNIAAEYGELVRIIYPVHRSPNVWGPVHRMLGGIANIVLTPPLDYLSMVYLLKRSYLVLTDSGGLQEEAPALGVPVLVLRESTERPEAVEAGTARLVGTDPDRIFSEAVALLENHSEYQQMAQATNPYGDGHAAKRIVSELIGETYYPDIGVV